MAQAPQWQNPHKPTASPETPDLRLLAAGTIRKAGRLDMPIREDIADPAVADIVALGTSAGPSAGWLLSGGEPTMRADLLQLLEACADAGAPRLGLHTDGLILTSDRIIAQLRDAGLQRVRIPLHSARLDAHDWLVDIPGAGKRALRAIKTCAAAGIEVEVEACVTRPTSTHLSELVEVLARLRVDSIHIRRTTGRGRALEEMIAISPRLGLAQPSLENAVRDAMRWGITPRLHLFPTCAAAAVMNAMAPVGSERWLAVDDTSWQELLPQFAQPESERGCPECPGTPHCAGAPTDYVTRFGRLELDSQSVRDIGTSTPSDEEVEWAMSPLSKTPPGPPARRGRTPATRVSFIHAQLKRPLHGDPMAGMESSNASPAIGIVFGGPSRVPNPITGDPGPTEHEGSRAIRIRMVRASQEGADVLRIASAGSLAHPDVAELLRDATRLAIPRVEVAGEASGIMDVEDVALRRLRRRITRFDVALYGPDAARHDAYLEREGAFEAALTTVGRLKSFARLQAGTYAILHDAADVSDYAAGWESGELPGEPQFRLAQSGDSLDALADVAKTLGEGDAQDALARVLPVCLLERRDDVEPSLSWDALHGDSPTQPPHSGSDIVGMFQPCPAAKGCEHAANCPGLAEGWTSERIHPLSEHMED